MNSFDRDELITKLLHDYNKLIWRTITSRLRSGRIPQDHAQDVYQEGCIKLVHKVEELNMETDDVKKFIWGVFNRASRNYAKKYYRTQGLELDTDAVPDKESSKIGHLRELIPYFQAMPVHQEVLYMAVDGHTQQDIASELNISQSTVSRIINKYRDFVMEIENE